MVKAIKRPLIILPFLQVSLCFFRVFSLLQRITGEGSSLEPSCTERQMDQDRAGSSSGAEELTLTVDFLPSKKFS